MKLSDVKTILESSGIPIMTWETPDLDDSGNDVPVPFATLTKPENGDVYYADNEVTEAYAVVNLFLVLRKDDEANELAMDRCLRANGFDFTYKMTYLFNQAYLVKTYIFNIKEDL